MTLRRGLFAAAIGASLAFAGAAIPAGAADFSDGTYGMDLPYVQGDLNADQPVLVAQRRRIVQPRYYYPPADNQQGYGQYPDQRGVYLQEPLPPRPNGQCLQSWQIERMLAGQGWRNFVNPNRGVDVVGLTASRPNGLTYRLKLDRCTGVILQANLLDQPDTRQSYGYNSDAQMPGY